MTCDAERERLLTGSTTDFADLAPHLSTCPSCGALAAAIRHTETDLRQHVEDFVSASSALPAQWDRAIAAVDGDRPVSRRLHRIVLVFAAIGVVAVAILTNRPPPGEPPIDRTPVALAAPMPLALRDAREKLDAFRAIDTTRLDGAGVDRATEDQQMKDLLQRKVAAMLEAERGLMAALETGDPEWRVAALGDLGDLYVGMADALEHFVVPSYLDEKQRAVYADALAQKAEAQREKGIAAWQKGASVARDYRLEPAAAALDAKIAALPPTRDPAGPR
jgi:hypothetical protein